MPDLSSIFPAYYRVTDEHLLEIWKKAIIVFDTNTWLNLYTYSQKQSDDFLKMVAEFEKQIWIPYRVIEEFIQNRLSRIHESIANYSNLKKQLNALVGELRKLREHKISTDDKIDAICADIDTRRRALDSKIESLKACGHSDDYTELLLVKFRDRIGEPWEFADDNAIEVVKKRAEEGIPPGGGDMDKPKIRDRYGDYILWQELLREGEKFRNPLIFVSLDGTAAKKDGWFMKYGEVFSGAHPYLIREYKEKSGKLCIFYTPEQFMAVGNKILNKQIASAELIAETKKTVHQDKGIMTIPLPQDELACVERLEECSRGLEFLLSLMYEQMKLKGQDSLPATQALRNSFRELCNALLALRNVNDFYRRYYKRNLSKFMPELHRCSSLDSLTVSEVRECMLTQSIIRTHTLNLYNIINEGLSEEEDQYDSEE